MSYQYGSNYASESTDFWSKIGSTYNTANFKFVGTPDGTTGATFSGAIASKTVYWGNSVAMATAVAALADGSYKVNFELVTESNNRRYYFVIFTKGPATSTPTIPTMTPFTGVSVSWVPASTAINDVEMEKRYTLYPSPAVSSIYVSGLDIESIDICSLSAKILMHSNEQKVNISKLPKGAYLAVVYTKSGSSIVKKFQKM